MNPPPVFTLSNGLFQSFQDDNQLQSTSEGPNAQLHDVALGGNQKGNDAGFSIPSIDFDWDAMVNVQADADWAWLNDVTNSTTGRLRTRGGSNIQF